MLRVLAIAALLLFIGGLAPALRGGAMSNGGLAPALRGGAMSNGGLAPALRGGAMWIAVARADRVHLVSGAVIEGKAQRDGGRVVIEIESGELALPADQVARIEPSESPVEHVARRRAQLGARDVAGRLALANYCRDHDMRGRETELLREVVELAPDHAEARGRLGYVRRGDAWVEREADLRAHGFVQYEGRWVTPEQALELERLRVQAEIAANERDKARAELEAKRVELEAKQAEQVAQREREAAQAESDRAAAASELVYSYGYAYGAPLAWPVVRGHAHHGHAHARDHACIEPDCKRHRHGPKRDDGRPPWPIVGTRDPFDYLR